MIEWIDEGVNEWMDGWVNRWMDAKAAFGETKAAFDGCEERISAPHQLNLSTV